MIKYEIFKNKWLKGPYQPVEFFDYDPGYKISAYLYTIGGEPSDRVDTLETSNGRDRKFEIYGKVEFIIGDWRHTLTVFDMGDSLFIPFTDRHDEVYRGGRYLDIKGGETPDGKLEIDFNFAYNPLCAYGGNYSCPFPPPENKLDIPIPVGMKYKKKTPID